MSPLEFTALLLREHQLAFLFPATVVEGPIVTVIAASLAAHGVLSPGLVFFTALAGDFGGDLLYYGLGRFGRREFLDRYGKYIGMRPEHLSRAEAYIGENSVKTMFVAKVSHVIGLAILFGVGMLRMSFYRFAAISIAIGIPKTAFFVGVGYFFGESYKTISQYLHVSTSVIIFFISFFVFYKAFHYMRWKMKRYG